jgi:hypothetical protein
MPWNEQTRRGLKLRDLHILLAVVDVGIVVSIGRVEAIKGSKPA